MGDEGGERRAADDDARFGGDWLDRAAAAEVAFVLAIERFANEAGRGSGGFAPAPVCSRGEVGERIVVDRCGCFARGGLLAMRVATRGVGVLPAGVWLWFPAVLALLQCACETSRLSHATVAG